MCKDIPTKQPSPAELREFARRLAPLRNNPDVIKRLLDAVEKENAEAFGTLVKELKLERFCYLLCHWICFLRCRLFCVVLCTRPGTKPPSTNPIAEISETAEALAKLAESEAVFVAATEAFRHRDSSGFRAILQRLKLLQFCIVLCRWFCSWNCFRICLILCKQVPDIDLTIPQLREFALAIKRAVTDEPRLRRLTDAVEREDSEAFGAVVEELKLGRFCYYVCHWICYFHCDVFCRLICPPAPTLPLFTHVGNYKITTHFTADGTTTVGNYAFTETIPLIGILPDGSAPDALEYRFRTEKYPLGGGPQDVTATMIPASRIGELEFKRWDAATASWVVDSAEYWVNQPGATVSIPQQFGADLVVPVNKDVKPGGWIEVPRENNLVNGGVGRFIPNTGILANLDTPKLTDEQFDLTVNAPPLPLKAGDSVPAAQRSEAPHYKIYFEAREVVGGAPVGANNLDKIALSNTHYKFTRHLDWAGGDVTEILVLSLDVAELIAAGCAPVSNEVHALFTAYHPYLGTCDVYIEGPGVPPPNAVTAPISAAGEALSPGGGEFFDIGPLQPCAYIVWLTATLRLTTGYGAAYGTFSDHIAFCKH